MTDNFDERMDALEVEDAWTSFLTAEFQDNESDDWKALVDELAFYFTEAFDVDNGESVEYREDAKAEFLALLADNDIDLYTYDWDDWRDWYGANA